MGVIASFVKTRRKQLKLTQEEFAEKAGLEKLEEFSKNAKSKGYRVFALTGSAADAIAKSKKLNCVKVQPGFQPRYSLGLSFFSLLKVFQELNQVYEVCYVRNN